MCETLENLIRRSQGNDQIAVNTLINKFQPLLKKLAAKLKYEDAYNDMVFDFLYLVRKISLYKIHVITEGTLVSYIHKSMVRAYYKRQAAIELYTEIPFSNLSEGDIFQAENTASDSGLDDPLELELLSITLNKAERDTIKLIFFYKFSVSEVAKFRGISRQAVNQIKNRALKKLRQNYE